MTALIARWTVRRKAEVLRQIDDGELSIEQALIKYGLGQQEITLWRRASKSGGVHALRTTKIQNYRDVFESFDKKRH